jgi:DNA-binding transcriptional MerR regulator
MRYRVDALASRAGVSVDTVRFYQARGLLDAPQREGRLAYYSDEHLENLARIRALKDKGFTLASIRRLLAGDLDPADEALVTALVAPSADDGDPAPSGSAVRPSPSRGRLTLDELAERTGVSPALLVAIEREGLLFPEMDDGSATYSTGDAAIVEAGLRLLQAGIPLAELLELARAHDRAVRPIVERAVELFDRHVRRPMRDSEPSGDDAAKRLVDAFNTTFGATTALVAHHFGSLLLKIAQQRIEESGR